MPSSASFVGRGPGFPLRTSATGAVAMVEDTAKIEEAIRLIVATAPGERPMRPEFGCRIHDHVFAPINEATIGTIAFEVERAITRWDPRVDVEAVDVFVDDDVEGLLYIEVAYRVKANNDERNLVFPFYTIPES
jgi:uncharacterized protein